MSYPGMGSNTLDQTQIQIRCSRFFQMQIQIQSLEKYQIQIQSFKYKYNIFEDFLSRIIFAWSHAYIVLYRNTVDLIILERFYLL